MFSVSLFLHKQKSLLLRSLHLDSAAWKESVDRAGDGLVDFRRQLSGPMVRATLLSDLFEHVLVVGSHVIQEEGLELGDFVGLNLVKVTSDTGVDDTNLLLTGEWLLCKPNLTYCFCLSSSVS